MFTNLNAKAASPVFLGTGVSLIICIICALWFFFHYIKINNTVNAMIGSIPVAGPALTKFADNKLFNGGTPSDNVF
jgi:hypothetical protein